MADTMQDVELGGPAMMGAGVVSIAQEGSSEPPQPPKVDDGGGASSADAVITNEMMQQASRKRVSPWKKSLYAILQTLLVSLTILLPAALIWLSADFSEYSFSAVKIGSPFTNNYREYMRYCYVLAAGFILFYVVDWIVWCLPNWILAGLKLFTIEANHRTKRRLHYMQGAHTWITISLWIIGFSIIGGSLLYKTSAISTVASGLLGEVPKNAASALAAIQPLRSWSFYFEKTLLVLFVFFILLALAKYFLELARFHFHRIAYEERVEEINYKCQVISGLYQAINSPGRHVKVNRHAMQLYLLPDKRGDFYDEKRTADLANDIYQALVPQNRDYLTRDDFSNYFSPEDLDDAFRVFDRAGNEDPSREEVTAAIMDIYQERECVRSGLSNNDRVIGKLDDSFRFCVFFLTITFAIPIFDLGAAAILVIFGILWTAIGYLFQNTAGMVFNSMVFVFVEHAFDVGDRVIIDKEFLMVERVEIFTTIFRRWDGTAVYIPNSELAGKNIYNIRRSGSQTDSIDLSLEADTSIDSIWNLRDRLVEYAKGEPKDFTGVVALSQFSVDGDKAKVTMVVEYRTNFQDAAVRASRKNKFMAMLKQIITEMNLKYYP